MIHDDYAEILFYDHDLNTVGSAIIDIEDVERCRPHKWMITEKMSNTQYVKSIIDGVNTGLHRFVLNYHGDKPVDHINRNGLDNRKQNLRVVSYSENSTNSIGRSATGKKNIYYKNGKFNIQVCRDYKKYDLGTVSSIEEAIIIRDSFIEEYNRSHNRAV